MARARDIIEGIDDPEGFGLRAHMDSPVARLALTNGFKRDDRFESEERYVKKLSNGQEAFLRTRARSEFDEPETLDPRDPQRHGGRDWEFVLVKPVMSCRYCNNLRTKANSTGKCPHCHKTAGVRRYNEYQQLARGSELVMNYLLGALLQRLATWNTRVPKPTLEALAVLEVDDPEMARIRKRVTKAKREREAAELAANPEVQQADDPTAFIQREVERRSEPIKKLEIRGRRWYRRGAGGVYCKAYIYINDKLVHVTPEQYGYGDHYLTLAKDWLTRNGYLEGLIDDERDPLWYLRDKHGIDLQYGVIDVPRERDL